MLGFFKKNKSKSSRINELYAVVDGSIIDIEMVDDETFSKKLIGDAIAFIPSNDTVVAPCDCTITAANDNMKHALGLTIDNGVEIIIHVGVNTVNLNGEGFKQLVSNGERVKKGQPLLKFDNDLIKFKGIDNTVMMIVTNDANLNLSYVRQGTANKFETVVIEIE